MSNVALTGFGFACFAVFLSRLFNFRLLYLFTISATIQDGELKLYILCASLLVNGTALKVSSVRLGPDLQHILQFIVRLS